MYESIWGLRSRPFSPTPEAARYFPADVIEEARQTLVRGIERAEGPGLLVGPAGSGKSLMCQLLALHFQSQFAIALLSSTRIQTTRDLLRAILFELGLPYRRMDDGELRLALIGFLSRNEKCPNGMLLVIDEAHSLNLRVLEELRMLSNLVRGGEPRVRLVLAGGPALEERFTHPKLNSFNQRLAARCYLRAWDRSETNQFMYSQMAAAGGDCAEIFSPEAIDQVHNATEGIPRLVVQLCDHTMMLAAAGGQSRIEALGIQEAWADLQQLPAPWNESSEPSQDGSGDDRDVVEFGELDEDGSDENLQPVQASSEPVHDDSMVEPISPPEFSDRLDATFDRVTATFGELDEACQSESLQTTEAVGPKLAAVSQDDGTLDEDFEDEEVIVDHYASLDAIVGRTSVEPLESEARELSAYFADETTIQTTTNQSSHQEPTAEPAESIAPEVDPYAEVETIPEKHRRASDPSADPVMPELQSLATITSLREEAPVPATNAAHVDSNSRDVDLGTGSSITSDETPMIVIEDGSFTMAGDGSDEPIARRQDYDQLFARLQDV